MSPAGAARTDSPVRHLWGQTWPMAFGILALLGFQLVDGAFVARLGTSELAAQSFTFPVTFLIIGVQVGLGIAIAALVSRALGADDEPRARRLGALALAGGAAIMLLLCVALWLVRGPLFAALGAEADLMPLLSSYRAPQLVASWLGANTYFTFSLFRAWGDMRLSASLMVVTSLVNLALDPLLIFGLGPLGDVAGFGLPGAAYASIVAFGVGLAMARRRLADASKDAWLSTEGLADEARRSAGPFLGIAGPAMISQLMPPLAAMAATSIVATLGETTVGAWGLASRVEPLSMLLVLALTMSLPPMLGRDFGRGDGPVVRLLPAVPVAGCTPRRRAGPGDRRRGGQRAGGRRGAVDVPALDRGAGPDGTSGTRQRCRSPPSTDGRSDGDGVHHLARRSRSPAGGGYRRSGNDHAASAAPPEGTIMTYENPPRFLAIFAAVFFVLSLLSGAGFFGAIGATILATVVVHFAMRFFASRSSDRRPPG